MKFVKLLLGVILLTTTVANAQPPKPQQPPSLIPSLSQSLDISRGGSSQIFQIDSRLLQETRQILIVLPASYSQSARDRRYPVTVVVDGEFLISPVAVVSDELSRNSQIPESVIVAIENVAGLDTRANDTKRVHDLTPPGLSVSGSSLNEGGEVFLDFIEKELLPAVDRQFRTSAPRFFVGVSSGAILATYAAATRSTYAAVVSLDAPINLGENWLAKKLTARATAGTTPVRYASLEAQFGWPEAAWTALVAAAPVSWKLYREKFQNEGHETMELLGAYLGLRQVFSDYSRFSAPHAPTTSILPYYTKISASLGAPLIPPKRVLEDTINDLLSEGQGAAAREAYNAMVFGYGAPRDRESLEARIAKVERLPAPTETVESLLATPFPTAEEAKTYLGEWVGDIWMGPDEPRTGATLLRLKVVGGRVVGETVRQTPDGEQTLPFGYLKITVEGMTWGGLNGRRPRGVVLFEGKLAGDTITGTQRWAGITLENPPPPLHFSFKRVKKQ